MLADATSAAEQERRQFLEDFATLAAQAPFRRVLWHVIDNPEFCRAFGLSAVAPGTGEFIADPSRIQFNEGRRSIGLALVSMLQSLDPKLYVRMLNEQVGLRASKAAAVQVPPPAAGQ